MALGSSPMELTPLDHMMPVCHNTFFYSFLVTSPDRGVQVLRESLRSLVTNFPFLAGNIVKSTQHGPPSHVLQVQPPKTSSLEDLHVLKVVYHQGLYILKWTHQPAEQVRYDSLLDERYLPLSLSLATLGVCPIIRWQANVMQDGIILAVSFHHSVFDGAGIHTIQHTLAKLCRQPNSASETISLSSDLMIGRKGIQRCSLSSQDSGSESTTKMDVLKTADLYSGQVLVSRRFSFNANKLKKLKDACMALVHGSNSGTKSLQAHSISSNDILSAFMWIVITKSRYGPTVYSRESRSDSLHESSLVLMNEMRRILSPPLPIAYVGNASIQTFTTASTESFLNSSYRKLRDTPLEMVIGREIDLGLLTRLAIQIYTSRKSVDDAYVKDIIQQKQKRSDWSSCFKQGDILSTSLRQMDVYGLDFGPILGKVVEFENPENRVEGSVCIMPARFNTRFDPWEIRMTLRPEDMAHVERDKSFQWVLEKCESKL